jgi:HD-GYP domain-containing protein (c-di-GMP phosphodiesterase class II)
VNERSRVRLAELVAALSLGIDLGFGQPMEHILRHTLIALRIAERLGLDPGERSVVYFTALMIGVGCHTDAHEQAKWFGDDIVAKSDKYDYDGKSLRAVVSQMSKIGAGSPLLHRFRIGIEFVVSGHRDLDHMVEHHNKMACLLAERLGLPAGVRNALDHAYEQWDGRGWPGETKGEDVPLAMRIGQVAEFVEVAYRVGGIDGAKELARTRAGGQFDPAIAKLVVDDGDMLFAGLDDVVTWDAVIEVEPALALTLTGDGFDLALEAIADHIDFKSPYFLGHAKAVSALAAAAAQQAGLPADEVIALRRAGLVCGFGRLGVSNAILDKKGPLGPGEWERVRMHPYLTERMLRQSSALAPLGAVAVQLRERLDGSGYPHGLSGGAISRQARILAVADAYQAMRELRPHRDAYTAERAASELRADVKAGRLDAEAVEAVLGAAGHRVLRRREGPAGLTVREVEVLRLLARGLTNKDIAAVLTITPKTVSNHIEHIYTKIGASTRAMASVFAVQHGLLPEEEFVPA